MAVALSGSPVRSPLLQLSFPLRCCRRSSLLLLLLSSLDFLLPSEENSSPFLFPFCSLISKCEFLSLGRRRRRSQPGAEAWRLWWYRWRARPRSRQLPLLAMESHGVKTTWCNSDDHDDEGDGSSSFSFNKPRRSEELVQAGTACSLKTAVKRGALSHAAAINLRHQ